MFMEHGVYMHTQIQTRRERGCRTCPIISGCWEISGNQKDKEKLVAFPIVKQIYKGS